MAVRKLLSHMSDTVSAGKLITLNLPAFSTINQIFLEFTNVERIVFSKSPKMRHLL